MIIWHNPALMQEVREGLEAAEHGQTIDRGSFAEYLDDGDDED